MGDEFVDSLPGLHNDMATAERLYGISARIALGNPDKYDELGRPLFDHHVPGSLFADPNEPQNPNCIANAVEGNLGVDPNRGITEAIGPNGPTGIADHDGDHVLARADRPSKLITLPLMAGTIIHTGKQALKGPDSKLFIVDILLNVSIKGEKYVMRLKDVMNLRVHESGPTLHLTASTQIGEVIGSTEPKAEAGLHVTLVKWADYNTYANNVRKPRRNPLLPSGNTIKMFISAARDPNSPFRCP